MTARTQRRRACRVSPGRRAFRSFLLESRDISADSRSWLVHARLCSSTCPVDAVPCHQRWQASWTRCSAHPCLLQARCARGSLRAPLTARRTTAVRSALTRSSPALGVMVARARRAVRGAEVRSLRLPGQSLSTVEVVLLAVIAACALRAATSARVPARSASGRGAWTALLSRPSGLGALRAGVPGQRRSTWRPVLRSPAAVWAADDDRRDGPAPIGGESSSPSSSPASIVGAPRAGRLRSTSRARQLVSCPRSGPDVAVVGAQVRASGPFQYPTIASMYLEIAFAVGLGVLVSLDANDADGARVGLAVRCSRSWPKPSCSPLRGPDCSRWRCRSLIVGALHMARPGFERTRWRCSSCSPLIAGGRTGVVAVAEMLTLRLTTEGQGRWFSAVYRGAVARDARHAGRRSTCRSPSPTPAVRRGIRTQPSQSGCRITGWRTIRTRSIAWEGIRTPVRPARCGPGQTVSLTRAGRRPRTARTFSPDVGHRTGTSSVVLDRARRRPRLRVRDRDRAGDIGTGIRVGPTRIPRMAVRPGRLVLWGAARADVRRSGRSSASGPTTTGCCMAGTRRCKDADPRVHSNNMYLEVLAGTGLRRCRVALLWLGVRTRRVRHSGAAFEARHWRRDRGGLRGDRGARSRRLVPVVHRHLHPDRPSRLDSRPRARPGASVMHIAFDGTTLRPGRTGVGYYTEHLLRHAAAQCGTTMHHRHLEPPDRDDRAAAGARTDASCSASWSPRLVWMQTQAPRMLRRIHADVVHFTNGMVPLASPVPTVVTIHDMSLTMYPAFHPIAARAAQPALREPRGAPGRRHHHRVRGGQARHRAPLRARRVRGCTWCTRRRRRRSVSFTSRPNCGGCASGMASPSASSCTSARSSRARTCRR